MEEQTIPNVQMLDKFFYPCEKNRIASHYGVTRERSHELHAIAEKFLLEHQHQLHLYSAEKKNEWTKLKDDLMTEFEDIIKNPQKATDKQRKKVIDKFMEITTSFMDGIKGKEDEAILCPMTPIALYFRDNDLSVRDALYLTYIYGKMVDAFENSEEHEKVLHSMVDDIHKLLDGMDERFEEVDPDEKKDLKDKFGLNSRYDIRRANDELTTAINVIAKRHYRSPEEFMKAPKEEVIDLLCKATNIPRSAVRDIRREYGDRGEIKLGFELDGNAL